MNNDRFKFRVWDKVSKRYFYLELKFGDNGYHTDFITDPVFEQCTGLKDKNGNLIYEGDIVGFYVYGQDEKWYGGEGTVIWYNSSWGIETSSRFICFENNIPMANPQGIEILGNIHEQTEQKD